MADKLLNVLDEIKRLKVTRAPKSNIYIHPNKYDMNKHAAASSVKSYTTKLYGNEGKRYNINESHYKDSIFAGFTGTMNQDNFKPVYQERATSSYMNKLFGIPDVKEFSNNDNTLYYEKKLGNKSELDFAVENFDDAEMKPETILEENDKAYNLNRLRTALNNKKVKIADIKASVSSEVVAAKAAKALKVSVAPAFNAPSAAAVQFGPVAPVQVGSAAVKAFKAKKQETAVKVFTQKTAATKIQKAYKALKEDSTDAMSALTLVDPTAVKRGRGRPRKVPVVADDATVKK